MSHHTKNLEVDEMKKYLLIFVILGLMMPLIAENEQEDPKESGIDIIPLLSYNSISLDGRTVHVPGGGVAVMAGEMEPETVEEIDNLLIVGLYNTHILKDPPLFNYPDIYHSVEFIVQRKIEHHQFYSLLRSYSDKPVIGGLETFAFVGGYGYEFIRNRNHSLVLGVSLGITDWGIELADGTAWPVLPLPFVHYDFTSRWLNLSFDFTTSPMVDIVIAPEQKLRFNGSFMITDLALEDIRDLKFDASLEYRFFAHDHPAGDFAGVKAGVMGEDYGYDLSGSDEKSLQVSWYAVYGTLDLSLLQITGGYAFSGLESYGNEETNELDEGLYFTLQLAYLF